MVTSKFGHDRKGRPQAHPSAATKSTASMSTYAAVIEELQLVPFGETTVYRHVWLTCYLEENQSALFV